MFRQARNGPPNRSRAIFILRSPPTHTARSIRRAAERKARKAAEKQVRLEQNTVETQSIVSEAKLAANRANAQLSTGPRSAEGKAISSMNAVKTGLTGRTVLLPSDDAEAYRQHIAAYENEFKPAGLRECELVQSLADIQWRLQRIPGLEMAIYARGRDEFAEQFEDFDPAARSARMDLETFIQYQKPLRNLQLQEGRLQRQREKDMAEFRELQQGRREAEQPQPAPAKATTPAGELDLAFLESLYAKATAPQSDPSAIAALKQFGFEISNPGRAGFEPATSAF
jgi:hypothetical protein